MLRYGYDLSSPRYECATNLVASGEKQQKDLFIQPTGMK